MVRNRQYQLFSDENNNPVNFINLDNTNNGDNWRVAASTIFRHKFKKKGRSFAISGGYNNSRTNGMESLNSSNSLLLGAIRQSNDGENETQQYKSSLLLTEPITKRWFWETFYNFNKTENNVNRQVADPENAGQRIDSLSVFYKNNTLYNRAGTSLRYAYEGVNVSFGLAAQQIRLNGEYSRDRNEPLLVDPISRSYNNFVPNIEMSYEFSNHLEISSNYNYRVTEPELQQLQPIPNVNNPAFRYVGNPDLAPETNHSIGLNLGYWNPGNFANFNIWSEYNVYDSKIVESQSTEFTGNLVRVTARPQNVVGGTRFSTESGRATPLSRQN
ncbi:MAG: TonB-dependent receptor [Lewinellaceae bacterium]|nr:TonB-dependent receptor [Lewinellaceae bacterium]